MFKITVDFCWLKFQKTIDPSRRNEIIKTMQFIELNVSPPAKFSGVGNKGEEGLHYGFSCLSLEEGKRIKMQRGKCKIFYGQFLQCSGEGRFWGVGKACTKHSMEHGENPFKHGQVWFYTRETYYLVYNRQGPESSIPAFLLSSFFLFILIFPSRQPLSLCST